MDLNDLVAEIKVETAYLPTLDIKDPFKPGASGGGNWILQHLKPRITIVPRASGVGPVTAAPFGDPGPTHWPAIKYGLLALAGLGIGWGLYQRLGP